MYKQVNQRWSLWQWVGGQKDYEDQPPVLYSMINVDYETYDIQWGCLFSLSGFANWTNFEKKLLST